MDLFLATIRSLIVSSPRIAPLIIVCFFLVKWAVASRPYTPIEPFALDETWRWSELEALAPYNVRQVDEAPDGTLWFAIVGGVLEYDGILARPHWFQDSGLEAQLVFDVKVASDGSVYALTEKMAARFKDGRWTRLFEPDSIGILGKRIDESADGSVWFGVRSGLYRVFGDEVTLVESHLDLYTSLMVDRRNRLWLVNALKARRCLRELIPRRFEPLGSTQSREQGSAHNAFRIVK